MSDKDKLNFVCAQCSAVNRVPRARMEHRPICARCKNPLIPGVPLELSDHNFDKYIHRTEALIIVDFWAPWCGPCRMMAPAFAEAAGRLTPQVILAKLDTDQSPNSAGSFNIQGIPCMIAFAQGEEIARQTGALDVDQIVRWVNSLIHNG